MQAEAALASVGACWLNSVCSRRRPRPGLCTCRMLARGLTSSASTTDGCWFAGLARSAWHRYSWPAGPLARGQGDAARWDRIRHLTARPRLLLSVDTVVEDLNRFLRGWAGYFRYGHSTTRLGKIRGNTHWNG